MCPNYTWINDETGDMVEIWASIADRDVPPPIDPGPWRRLLEAPMVLKASYLDGQRKDLVDFKAINKLEGRKSDHPEGSQERKEIQREIDQRRKI